MNAVLSYLKAIISGVGAVTIPPIVNWIVTYIPAPTNVQTAFSILITFAITGGIVAGVPNIQKGPQT